MRRYLPLVFTVAIVATLSIVQRDVIADIFERLASVHPAGFVPLFMAGALVIVARAAFLRACSPDITLGQAVVADQSALAAGYGIALGGGAVGTAMRIHMFTRWGLAPQTVATSIVATAVIPSFTTWGLPIVVLAWPLAMGQASVVETTAVIAGVVLVGSSAVFWGLSLTWPKVFETVGRFGEGSRRFLLRRLPARWWRIRRMLTAMHPRSFTEELRLSLGALVRRHGPGILAASVGTLAASFTCLLVSAWLFGVSGIAVHEMLIAFSLLRVLIALSPVPGAVGIAEVGLVALLEEAGMSVLDATGTTLLYRFLTWFLPIVVGTVTWWRYSHNRNREGDDGQVHHHDSQHQDPGRGVRLHGRPS